MPAILVGLLCLGCALLAIAADALFLSRGASLTREGGAVELASALFYLLALGAFLSRAGERRVWLWPVPVLLAAMALREFDADKRFTSEGVLGIKILTRDTPLWEKALGIVVVGGLLLAIAVLLRRTLRPFLSALMRFVQWALWTAAAILLAVFTKSIDGLARKLEPLGIPISEEVSRAVGGTEEYLELGIPLLILMAILSRF